MTSLETFITSLQKKPAFSGTNYADRLQAACKASSAVQQISSKLPSVNNVSSAASFDGQDCSRAVQLLAVGTCARGLSQVTDDYGFHGTVNADASIRLCQSVMTGFVPYALADDIDSHLATSNISGLNTLKGDSAFVKAYNDELIKPSFVKKVRDHDRAASSHEFGMTLLFIHQFFATNGRYEMLQSLPSAGDTAGAIPTARTWFTHLTPDLNQITGVQDLLWLSSCVSSVYVPNGLPEISIASGVALLAGYLNQPLSNVAQQILGAVASGAASTYNGLSSYIWAIWDGRTSSYVQSMLSAATDPTSWDVQRDDPHTYCSGGMAARCVTVNDHYTLKVTRYGDALSGWCSSQAAAHPSCFKSGPPGDSQRTRTSGGPSENSSCFAPGTLVLTDRGNKPIESLRENDVVVTSTLDRTTGYCSDEKVVHPTHQAMCDTILYGFNDQAPFFTAGHVFYTTTGLRAINPMLAVKENPWLDVGRLRVGHKLLHAEALGDEYRAVTIESLHNERARCDAVYGVHLREGLRSYHANGYLVRANYPEITLATLAKDIRSLPKPQQLGILGSMKELSPILRRFGGDTVLQALERETKANIYATPKKCHPKTRVNLRHMTRVWNLHPVDAHGEPLRDSDVVLPDISLTDGILHIDGQYCERSAVKQSILQWTRPISDTNKWEHGTCFVSEHGVAGQGYMFTSDENDPLEPPKIHGRVRFVATIPRKEHLHPIVRAHRSPGSSLPLLAASDDGDDPETFALVYGKKGATNTIEGGTTKLFDMISTSTSPGSGALILPDCQIPLLDRLQSLLQHQLRQYLKITNDDQSIVRLYEVASTLDKNNETVTTVTLLYPDLVYRASDDYALGDQATKTYRDLTYKNVQFDEKLPLLFSTFSFASNWDGTKVLGSVIHYDPLKPGTKGEEFGISGDLQDTVVTNLVSRVAATNAAYDSFLEARASAGPNRVSRKPHDRHAAPAPATFAMAAGDDVCAPMSAQSLAELSPWSESEVHSQSQTLLYQTMLYHIDDTYRATFFSEAKPTGLDSQLTDGLATDTKDWIKNTYGPAYICNRLESVDDVTKSKWRRHFTNEEQKKLRWFWVGKGPKSIYRSPHYTVLNEVTAAVAVRSLHKCLDNYIKDLTPDKDGATGGKKWSNALYHSMSTSHSIAHLVNNFRLGAGESLLTKHCNVMHALDSDRTNANNLADKVRRKLYGDTSNTQPNTPDDSKKTQQDEYMWCHDSMYQLILSVLNSDPKMNADIRNSLMTDIQTLMTQYQINQRDANDKKALALVNNAQGMIQQMSALFRSMRLAKGIGAWEGIKGWAKATTVGGWIGKMAANPKVGVAFKGLTILVGVGLFLTSAIGAFCDWKNLNTEQRADLILNTLITVAGTVGGALELWDMIKEMKANPTPADVVREQTATTILDEKQRVSLTSSSDDDDQLMTYRTPEERASDMGEQVAEDLDTLRENPDAELDPMTEATPQEAAKVPKAVKSFNTGANWVRGAIVALSAAVTIVMIVQIAKNWDKMDLVDRILGVAQVVQQGLTVLVDAGGLLAEGLFAFGQIAEATLTIVATCLAWAGALLAVIGLALMIGLMIYNATKDPPLDPVEEWIEKHGQPFLDGLDAPPNSQLSYSASPDKLGGNDNTLTITAANKTDTPLSVAQIEVFFQTGDDPGTLTTEEKYVVWAAGTDFRPGDVRLAPPADTQYIVAVNSNSSQRNAKDKPIIRERVLIAGKPHTESGHSSMNVTVPAKSSLQIQVCGTISTSGLSTIEVQETSTDEKPVSEFFQVTKK